MADLKFTELTAQTIPNSTTIIPVVDTADATMGLSGTNLKLSINDLAKYINSGAAYGGGYAEDDFFLESSLNAKWSSPTDGTPTSITIGDGYLTLTGAASGASTFGLKSIHQDVPAGTSWAIAVDVEVWTDDGISSDFTPLAGLSLYDGTKYTNWGISRNAATMNTEYPSAYPTQHDMTNRTTLGTEYTFVATGLSLWRNITALSFYIARDGSNLIRAIAPYGTKAWVSHSTTKTWTSHSSGFTKVGLFIDSLHASKVAYARFKNFRREPVL